MQCIDLRVEQGARQAGSKDSFQPQHLKVLCTRIRGNLPSHSPSTLLSADQGLCALHGLLGFSPQEVT